MKGIILAGGNGTRLHPTTLSISKQLIPVYDKPMIYYPLSVLMLAGIKDILIISSPEDLPKYKLLFDKVGSLGLNLTYKVQPSPEGIAQAFLLGEEFIANDPVCLILGDNIFYGDGLVNLLNRSCAYAKQEFASVYGYHVNDPQRYGVIEFDENFTAKNLEEKPLKPKSNYAVTGIYFYPNNVISLAKTLSPSERGELEITDLNNIYLKQNKLKVEVMGQGFAWLDTGTHDSLLDASNFIQTIENRQGLKIACLEEISFKNNFINLSQFKKLIVRMKDSSYSQYLKNKLLAKNEFF